MAIRIGNNPNFWSNDDLHELGGQKPLETCLRDASIELVALRAHLVLLQSMGSAVPSRTWRR